MLIFISRKGRKGRRTSNANYAIAEVVAGYALSSHHLIINPIPRRHGGLEILEDSFSFGIKQTRLFSS